MRRLSTKVTVFIATMALVTACSVIDRFDPSMTTIGPAGRVELPEAGIALTFPDDWRVETRPASDSEALTSIREPDLRGLLTPIVAAMPATMHDRCVVVDLAPLVDAQPAWSTLDDVVAGYRGILEADSRWVGVKSTVIDLPAGRTGHILRSRDGEAESASSYVFARAEAWFRLECVAHTVPAQDWYPIAETFEFLALAPASSSPPSGQAALAREPQPPARTAPAASPLSSGHAGSEPSPHQGEPVDLPSLFPTAAEISDALGLEVEAMGIRDDMSQLWEGIDIEPSALLAKRMQGYRWPPADAGSAEGAAFAGVFVDIGLFRSPTDGATYGEEVAAGITGPLAAFLTDLSADLVAAGSWTSDQGFGGSTVVVQEGPLVVIVTAARTGVTELQTTAEAVITLVLHRIRGAA